MTVSVNAPFALFVDAAGDPLDDGYVYVGQPNLNPVTNPIGVFWDEALTIPAAQPLRTSSGVIVRSGSPANIFVGSDYSIAVHDGDNAQIYTAPTQSGLPVTGGSITLASGESLTAQNGSDVILDDGSELRIGDNTGVGVLVTVAANARIVGNLIPNVNEAGGLGTATRRWASANIAVVQVKTGVFAEAGGVEVVGDDAQPFAEVVGQEVRGTTVVGFNSSTAQASGTEALALNQHTTIMASGRISSTGVLSTNHKGVNGNATHTPASGVYRITLDVAVEDDAVILAASTSTGADLQVLGYVETSGTVIRFDCYQGNPAALADMGFQFLVVGRPRGGVANPIA